MGARGLIHHLDLTVSDLARSRRFYDRVLTHLGYVRGPDTPNGTDWDRTDMGVFSSIGLVGASAAGAGRPHDRTSPGLHHLAWQVDSRAEVDAVHALMLAEGAHILDPPAIYAQYHPHYYAVFFADPDGLKLEVVYIGR